MHDLAKVTAVEVRGMRCGEVPLFLIAGPCVIEEDSVMRRTAEALAEFSSSAGLPSIFKSSFQKDNTVGHYLDLFGLVKLSLSMTGGDRATSALS